jgi:hypothetical protein
LVQLIGPGGDVLMGKLFRIARSNFIEGYQKTLGTDSIAVYGPAVSFSDKVFGGIFGSVGAQGRCLRTYVRRRRGRLPETRKRNPRLLDSTASLQGDNGSAIGCYFIRSVYTAQRLGGCKSDTGKDTTRSSKRAHSQRCGDCCCAWLLISKTGI